MDDKYLSQLNDQQRAAVEYIDGPQLVIAGAGSGKTRVLTYKIVHLLANNYEPSRILALTFTNKAAREMRERIEKLVGERTAARLWMGTFHSIFSRILRQNAELIGYTRNYTIYDTSDSRSLIKTIVKDMQLDEKIYKPSTVQNAISMAKNALMSPADYAADRELIQSDVRARRGKTVDIYRVYVERCRVADAMDFDDLLYNTARLLRDNPGVLDHYREFFRYVLVDEFQDTNFAQNMIVTQLTRGIGKLCVVGDDAQSIYSFRGANIRNILEMKRTWTDLLTFKLEQNYRSTQNIINAANSLIAKNSQQIRKAVFSKNDAGERIEVQSGHSDYDEAGLVASRIVVRRAQSGEPYSEFAILYRTNAQSRVLEEALRRRNIPYRIYGGLAFYQRKEIKDALSYFRLAVNPRDDEAIRRAINTPARGIGETTVKKLSASAIEHRVSMWDVLCDPHKYELQVNSGTLKKINGFVGLITDFIDKHRDGADADELAKHIITRTGLLAMYLSDRTPESISKQENLQELLKSAHDFVADRREEGLGDNPSMADFLADVSLATDQDTDDDSQPSDSVTLMTIHSAKGLEFSNIFVVGVEEELLPSSMSTGSAEEVEEERRLFYVAITRAKKFCMLSYASSYRYRNGQPTTPRPSRFLKDIDGRYLNYTYGSRESYSDDDFGVRRPTISVSPSTSVSRQTSTSTSIPKQNPAPAGVNHRIGDLKVGMRIAHSRFGKGTIEKLDTKEIGDIAIVNFDNSGSKQLLLKFAQFDII
ncbi:MAG: UvrD-helicase domain-containing protein [Bacteroidales bacterium]|nr:UvrD-helicase domain-containing protein [Bacteroidales bacterium]